MAVRSDADRLALVVEVGRLEVAEVSSTRRRSDSSHDQCYRDRRAPAQHIVVVVDRPAVHQRPVGSVR